VAEQRLGRRELEDKDVSVAGCRVKTVSLMRNFPTPLPTPAGAKVFWFFFSKKNILTFSWL
jgi:hypothetical protein